MQDQQEQGRLSSRRKLGVTLAPEADPRRQVAVKRSGSKVWIGEPGKAGYVMHWRNAQAAREAQVRFTAALRVGWPGELVQLVQTVRAQVDAGQRLVDVRTRAQHDLEHAREMDGRATMKCPRCTGSGIDPVRADHDPDWCNDCGGGGLVADSRALVDAEAAFARACEAVKAHDATVPTRA